VIFLKTQTSCALAAPEKRLVTQNEHEVIAAATLFKIIFGALKFDCYFRRRCVRIRTPDCLACPGHNANHRNGHVVAQNAAAAARISQLKAVESADVDMKTTPSCAHK
jgi:hypothetical protein